MDDSICLTVHHRPALELQRQLVQLSMSTPPHRRTLLYSVMALAVMAAAVLLLAEVAPRALASASSADLDTAEAFREVRRTPCRAMPRHDTP